jgi:hypothetical protein
MTHDKLTRQIDAIEKAFGVILEPGQIVEIRSLSPLRSKMFGTSKQGEARRAAEYAARLSAEARGVYYTPNPLKSMTGSGAGGAAKDSDVAARRWLLIDVDSRRPKDTNATDAEKAASRQVADAIVAALTAHGMAGLVVCDSGNGWHIMASVTLPNDEAARHQVKHLLMALDERFSNASAMVDVSPSNAARIWKCPYTLTKKGEPTAERPARWSSVIELPDDPRQHAESNTAALARLLQAWPIATATNGAGDALQRYIESAIDRECGRVSRGGVGERNDTLNIAAHNLGQLVGGGYVDRATIEAALLHAARACGLPDREAERTIRSGIEAGVKKPRQIPVTVTQPSANGKAGHADTLDAVEWEEPVAVDEAADIDAFPADVFPVQLLPFVREVTASMNVPADYAGLCMLAVAGGAIGNSRLLVVKNKFRLSSAIYGVFVAKPGSKKSSLLSLVAGPMLEAEKRFDESYRRQRDEWEQAGRPGSPPTLRRVVSFGRGSTEGLINRLTTNQRGITVVADELSGLLAGMNQYKPGGKGNDRQFYLSAWDQQPFRPDLVDPERSILIARPFLSIVGGIQPDMLPVLRGVDHRGKIAGDDGFYDRFLIAYPPEPPARGENWQEVSDGAYAIWLNAVDDLLSLPQASHGGPEEVTLSLEARAEYTRETERHADEVNARDFDPSLAGAFAKLMPGYLGRFALILHMLDQVVDGQIGNEVCEMTIRRAARLVMYFKQQARRAAGLIVRDDREKAAMRVLDWLRRRPDPTTPARHLEVLRSIYRSVGNSDSLRVATDYLADLGLVEVIEPADDCADSRRKSAQSRRSKNRTYVLNPKALTSASSVRSAQSARPVERDIKGRFEGDENAPTAPTESKSNDVNIYYESF